MRHPYIHRSEASLKGLRFLPSAFVRGHLLAEVPTDNLFLFGDFVRAAFSHDPWTVIDVALGPRVDRVNLAGRVPPEPRVAIHEGTITTAEELLARAPFTISQVVYADLTFHMSGQFFEHLAQRILVVNRESTSIGEDTLRQAMRLVSLGYTLPSGELDIIINALRTTAPRGVDADTAESLRRGP